jgi:hypothetical protein
MIRTPVFLTVAIRDSALSVRMKQVYQVLDVHLHPVWGGSATMIGGYN